MGSKESDQKAPQIELIWIDALVNNSENTDYKNRIQKNMSVKFSCFENVPESLEYLKKLKFVPTYIITSGRLYPEFIREFKSNINEYSICPKIVIFCGNKYLFLERNYNNKDLPINHPYYNAGGIQDTFIGLEEFLLKKDLINIEPTEYEIVYDFEDKINFEYIRNQDYLILPLFLSKYMKKPPDEKIEKFNKLVLEYYSNNEELKYLFNQLIEVQKIPYEILYKFWLKAFSLDNNLNIRINEELKLNNFDKYLVFVLAMYEGKKTNKISLEISNDTSLYRYTSLSKAKLNNMNFLMSKKKENLPSIVMYSQSFLSFYFDEKDASTNNNNKEVENNILLVIENAKNNLNYCSGYTSLDIYNNQKNNQILFFPYLFFEILKIENIKDNNYKIYLGFIGKYENLFNGEDQKLLVEKIPENSSITSEIINIDMIDDTYNDVYNIITLKYKVNPLDNKISIFGKKFVENNKNNCYMIIDGNRLELKEELDIKIDIKENTKELIIKLAGLNKITDISYLFEKCECLIEAPNISKINTKKITNMSSMFKHCSNLESLPDISKWNTSNVNDMSYLFANCSSLKKIPDISKWDTSNVTNLSHIFDSCTELKYLPNISKWNINKVNDISYMFNDLHNLDSLPDISNWNTEPVKDMCSLFKNCSKLTALPDISKWNTKNTTNTSFMFYDCKSLNYLPNISIWDINKDINMENMFNGIKQSIEIPEKFKSN